MAGKVIRSEKLVELLKAEGIIPGRASRVVIDAQAGEPIRLYVTLFGDEDLIRLGVPMLKDAEVTVIGREV